MNNLAEDVGICGWPSVVRAGYYCSGVYIGSGLVLTAAHCIDGGNNIPGGRVSFGESETETTVQIDVEAVFRHPDGETSTNIWGEPSYSGVDLAVCVLAGSWSGPATPVMRLGCESNWLNYAFFNLEGPARPRMRAVGVGCNEVNYNAYPTCVASGQKRVWNATLDRHYPQVLHTGSYKLSHLVPPWQDDHPVEEGDSGSPLFVRMPDNTWRVIGICHGTSDKKAFWEPVPPFLDWIEEVTGRNLSSSPGPGYLSGEDEAGSWNDSCAATAGAGQFCGGAPLIPPSPLGEAIPANPANHVETWVVEGLPELRRFRAAINVDGEAIDVSATPDAPGNPLEIIAAAIRCHSTLRNKGVSAFVEGAWLKTNGRLKFDRVQLPGGAFRRSDCFRPEGEELRNGDGFFLSGRWEAYTPERP